VCDSGMNRRDQEQREGGSGRLTHLSASFFSPPKATTVRIEEITSSATAPAAAYALCSLTVKEARICREEE